MLDFVRLGVVALRQVRLVKGRLSEVGLGLGYVRFRQDMLCYVMVGWVTYCQLCYVYLSQFRSDHKFCIQIYLYVPYFLFIIFKTNVFVYSFSYTFVYINILHFLHIYLLIHSIYLFSLLIYLGSYIFIPAFIYLTYIYLIIYLCTYLPILYLKLFIYCIVIYQIITCLLY